ncbi:hypothetical protein [Archangium sp.]|uniref:hypothetical protein n=1 Tax=Archangium sp. TaxID=1872627 RepID=UPI002D4DF51C|nr:hypothetical protein [Archangium sp.]HYO57063.1 hypothetical protein [Archangium sp.]
MGRTKPPPTWDGNLTVLVCRDSDCGSSRKHPDVDHTGQMEALEEAVQQAGGARLLVPRCLDACSHSNVVVVRHRGPAGSVTTWFEQVLSRKRTRALCDWLAAGGPREAVPLPPTLAAAVFTPTRESAAQAAREEPS